MQNLRRICAESAEEKISAPSALHFANSARPNGQPGGRLI